MTQHNDTGTKESVLATIKEKGVSQRPKSAFIIEAILAGIVAIVILLVSIAIVSFILFALRINGHESLLGFGPRGFLTFLLIFPWPLLILDVLLIVFLESQLRRFKFAYRSPILYLLLGLIAVAIGAGILIDQARVNDSILRQADTGGIPPPIGGVYRHVRVPAPHDQGVYRGVVSGLGTSSILITHEDMDTDDRVYTVVFPEDFPTSTISIGDQVYVAGDANGTLIHAFGIRVRHDQH